MQFGVIDEVIVIDEECNSNLFVIFVINLLWNLVESKSWQAYYPRDCIVGVLNFREDQIVYQVMVEVTFEVDFYYSLVLKRNKEVFIP